MTLPPIGMTSCQVGCPLRRFRDRIMGLFPSCRTSAGGYLLQPRCCLTHQPAKSFQPILFVFLG